MRRKKVNLEHIKGLLTVLIPRMEETTKRQLLSLIFLVMATILEYIRGLLTVLIPKMEDSTKRQIHSLLSLVMATMFFTTPFVTTVGATPSYTFAKIATNVTGNGTPGNVTAAGNVISYNLSVTNTGDNRTNVTVIDPLIGNLSEPTVENSSGNPEDLDPGESWVFTGNYIVTQEDINSNGTAGDGLINNTANITVIDLNDSSESNTSFGSASNYTPIIWNPSYAINKTVIGVTGNGSGNVTAAGNLISYNVNVTNNGNVDLTNVIVNDPLLTGNFTGNNDTILNTGEIWTYTGNYTVSQADINSNGTGTGLIINNATVDCDQLGLLNDNATTRIIQNANYTIDKNVINVAGQGPGGNVTAAGQVIRYNVNVTNTGNIDLTNVIVNDPLLTGNFTGNNDTILNTGEIWTYTGNYTVSQADINSNGTGTGLIINNATVDCDQLGLLNDNATTRIIQNANYTIDKNVINVAGQGPGGNVTAAGQVIRYNVNVTNTGNIDLTNVIVNDPLLTGNFTGNNDTILNAGEIWTYTGNYTVSQADINSNGTGTGLIINNATVDCDQLGLLNDNATTRIIQNANYTIDKNVINVAGQGPGGNVTAAGQVIRYNVNVTNIGSIDLTNVTVTDPLLTGNFTGNNDTILNAGEIWTYTGNYTVSQADINNNGNGTGYITNNATVDCYQLDPKNATVQTPIANYTIVKTVTGVTGSGNGNVTVEGNVINYNVNVTNNGKVNLTNVTVTDPLIGNFTGLTKSINNDTVLNAGEIWTYTGNYTVTRADITNYGNGTGFIINNATVDCVQLDPKNSTVQIPIDTACSIDGDVIDVAGQGPEGTVTAAGDVITYQIDVINEGITNLTNVTVDGSLTNPMGPTSSNNNDTVLNAGEIWTYTEMYTVTQADIDNNGTVEGGLVGNALASENTGNGFITNTVTFNSDQLGPKSYNSDEVPIERNPEPIEWNPDYSIIKSVIGPDENGDCIVNSAGDEIPYRIMVTNEGNEDLTNVEVSDSLVDLPEPTGDGNYDGVLNVGETWRYDVIYKLTSEDVDNGNVNNIATVICSELPEEIASVDTPVDQNADLSIYKSAIGIDEDGNQKIDNTGDIINYQVAVKNNGDVDLTGISVDDPMVTLTKSDGDHNDPGILNPGETWVYTGDYAVTQEDINSVDGNGFGYITNTATVDCNENLRESSSYVLPFVIVIKSPDTNVIPVADFSTSVKSGNAPLSVQFTDKSTGSPTSWSWDFNGDGISESSVVNPPAYTYTTPGTYVAKLTVSNANGSSSPKTETINVLQPAITTPTPTSTGGGGGHSSGGSSGTATVVSSGSPATNAITNVTQPENNTPGLDQNNENTPAKVVQTPTPKATSTPVKKSTKTPGFETMFGITALLGAVFLCRRR